MERAMWPTLLSPYNLPALAASFDVVYRIATTPTDCARIMDWPIYRGLADIVRTEFVTDRTDPDVAYHVDWYHQAIAQARAARAFCLFLPPDVAWSDGTFGHATAAIRAGKFGVSIPYIRVVSETCFPEVAELAKSKAGIAPPDAVRLALRHLHPLSATVLVNGRHARPSVEAIWRIPGEGILLRHMVRELSLFDPCRMEPTTGWNAGGCDVDDLHIVVDSDDMLMLSFAPALKDSGRIGVYIPEHSLKPIDLARISLHPMNDSPLINEFARRAVRIHYKRPTGDIWRRVERRGDAFMKQVLFMREFLRLWMVVRDKGHRSASRLMSVALQGTRLAARWRYDGPVTAFIPNDAAFQSSEGLADGLLAESARFSLIATVLNHVCAGRIVAPSAGGTSHHETLGGHSLQLCADESGRLRVNGSVSVVDEIEFAPHRVLVIDKWLTPELRAT
jgi:uncharacterized surface protein with fasciclin (FAS1) repeats